MFFLLSSSSEAEKHLKVSAFPAFCCFGYLSPRALEQVDLPPPPDTYQNIQKAGKAVTFKGFSASEDEQSRKSTYF